MWKTVSSWLHASLCALGVISFAARPSARPNRVLCAVCHILQCVIFIFCAACSARCGLQAVCVISFTASELNCDGMRAARNNSFHIQTCCANSFFPLKKWSRELYGIKYELWPASQKGTEGRMVDTIKNFLTQLRKGKVWSDPYLLYSPGCSTLHVAH